MTVNNYYELKKEFTGLWVQIKTKRKWHKMQYWWWFNVGKLVCYSRCPFSVYIVPMHNYYVYFGSLLLGHSFSDVSRLFPIILRCFFSALASFWYRFCRCRSPSLLFFGSFALWHCDQTYYTCNAQYSLYNATDIVSQSDFSFRL